jgi:hypothetical protein
MDPAQESQPSFRRESPSPSRSPTLAIGAGPELYRCISTGSSVSMASGGSSSMGRESMGSTTSSAGTSVSRSSSASYTQRQSLGGSERPKRRGYVKPQGTYFSESAKSRYGLSIHNYDKTNIIQRIRTQSREYRTSTILLCTDRSTGWKGRAAGQKKGKWDNHIRFISFGHLFSFTQAFRVRCRLFICVYGQQS